MQRFARLASLAAWLILLHSHADACSPGWIRVSTPHLEMLTTGDAVAAAEAVNELESLRDSFRRAVPTSATTEARLRIVAFSSEWEYQAFRVNSYSPAYFVGGPGQEFIVLGRLAKDTIPSLRHEYVHYLLKQRPQRLPLWLEEGLAEYHGGVSRDVARARSHLLSHSGWIPVEELFKAGPNSAWYRDRGLAARFYAESWALTDLLMKRGMIQTDGSALDEEQPSNRVEEALARNGDRQESDVWRDFHGAPAELEKDLRAHVRELQATQLETAAAVSADVAPADRADVELSLARLQARNGDLDGARIRAARIADESSAAWSVMGDVALKQGRTAEARAAFRTAMQNGAADVRTLWQLAVLEQSAPDGDMVPVLEKLVAADPSHDDARLVLSSHYLRQERWSDALSQLRQVRNAPPDKAEFYQRALALAESRGPVFAASRAAAPRPSDSLE